MPANALQHVAWEPCLLEARRDDALESYARKKLGVPHPTIRYYVDVPWLARALVDLHPEFGLLVHLDLGLGDLIQLVVSQENTCRYCYAAVRASLRIQGMSEARIRSVEGNLARADLTPREAAAIAFARAQSRAGPPAAAGARQVLLDAGVSAPEVKEIAFVAASTDFMNRASTLPAIPPYVFERAPDRLGVRLLRPWIARALRAGRSRGRATPLERVPSYPYAGLVEAFAGSPIAPVLAKTFEEMWASPGLTRRCKLLMFAVIAHGLGCGVCASEAARALQKEGLSQEALTSVLTHLDAPGLDPVERLLVPFARETIWYEPAPLQRRARGVRDQLSGTQFLEAVGVLSLANGLCRLGATVADHP
ncbi:MAG TPA: carboxymuconolactone decarboxylase family protein [Methylomirabilota bacterium]|nr:carboxymuconolactone decarboxylase family protein [Methylomirabilota bacterium]